MTKQLFLLTFLSFFLLSGCSVFSQPGNQYWQQSISYTIDVDFDAANHRFAGVEKIVYQNNSSDEFEKIYFHLYYNAFKPGSMMDVRSRTINDPDSRVGSRIETLSENEIGYHKITSVTQNGSNCEFNVEGTIMEVKLSKKITQGNSAKLELHFNSQVPVQIRRTGRDNKEGVDYSMTQWYPKVCEYDKDGWHTNPYIGREFHGVWGSFDVSIRMDSSYIIGGTGVLQNPREIGHGYLRDNSKLKRPEGDKLQWHFKAENVHDFAWAADRDYIHDIYKVNDKLDLHFFYQGDTLVHQWKKTQSFTADAFRFMNLNFGEYPYSQFSIIQGGDGGMEYPMATLITGHGSQVGLNSVIVHEALHSWYHGVLATNESKYPWMDEGFTQYAQYETLHHLYKSTSTNPHKRGLQRYVAMATGGHQEPLSTHADHFELNSVYGSSSYYKGETFLSQLSYILGKPIFMEGMKNYFDQWKFKHPEPRDFKRVMEKTSGIELDWYFENFIQTTKTIDYGIREIIERDGNAIVVIDRIGEMPMPLDLLVVYEDSTSSFHNIPLRIMRGSKNHIMMGHDLKIAPDWPWVYPSYELKLDVPRRQIKYIVIDVSERLADTDMSNNIFPSSKDIRYRQEE